MDNSKSSLQDRMNESEGFKIKPGEEVSMTREEALAHLGYTDSEIKKMKLKKIFQKLTKDEHR